MRGRWTWWRRLAAVAAVVDPALAEKYAPLMARSDFTTAAEYLSEDILDDNRAGLAAASTPIWEICPHYRSLLATAPNATVVSIEPALHYVMLDQPDVFNETVTVILI